MIYQMEPAYTNLHFFTAMKKADVTRLTILQKAFQLIYAKGYQATSIDDILATTQVTKGAFYYHFRNKDAMGLAIINEILKPNLTDGFLRPEKKRNPLDAIYDMIHYLLMEDKFLKAAHGCPVSNLTQEMSPWNRRFSKALGDVTENWHAELIGAIEAGKEKGLIRRDANAGQVALFVMSGYWGIRNLGKLQKSKTVYPAFLKELRVYLESLK